MKTRFGIILSLSLGLLSANAAQANDAVLGAILGGGLGAVVGNHVGGRDGAAIGGAVGAAAGVVIATDEDHGHRRPRHVHHHPGPALHARPGLYAGSDGWSGSRMHPGAGRLCISGPRRAAAGCTSRFIRQRRIGDMTATITTIAVTGTTAIGAKRPGVLDHPSTHSTIGRQSSRSRSARDGEGRTTSSAVGSQLHVQLAVADVTQHRQIPGR